MKPVRPPVTPCMISLRNFMANVYEHLLHGRGTVALLCQTPVSPLIVIATVYLSTDGILTLAVLAWYFRTTDDSGGHAVLRPLS